MDKVVHFEIPYDDKERAERFYKDVFEWGINSVPEMKYTMVHTAKTDDKGMIEEKGAINGGMFKRPESKDLKSPLLIINVNDIDEAIEKIKNSGGKIVRDKRNVGDMGIVAYFEDTEGNVLGVWQELKRE